MTHPLRTLGALALGATIVAVAALTVRSGPVAGAPATDAAPHTITVSASGKVTIVPDVARVQLGVTIARPTVKAARDAGAKAMTDILATIKSLGIADADVQTTNVSLYPQYGNGSPAKVVGYQISEQVQVTVRDLDKTGDVIDGATAHGATDVNGVSFELADPVKAQNDARAAAVAAARVSAEAMATAGHVSLGAVVSITDATPVQSPIFYNYGAPAGRGRWRDDPGQAGHPGPRRERDRGLRHRLTPRIGLGLRAGLRLADLDEVSVRIAEEGADLPVGLDRLGQEGRAPVAQRRERRPAVGDPDRHRMTDDVRVGRRRERDRRLVGGRAAAGDEEQPRPEGAQDARGPAVLAVYLGAEHVAIERACPIDVGHDQDVGELHPLGRKAVAHRRPAEPLTPGPPIPSAGPRRRCRAA